MAPFQLIGIHGAPRSGKDTIAAVLASHGYTRLALADALRSELAHVFALTLQTLILEAHPRLAGGDMDPRGERWQALALQALETKALPALRPLMQEFGTEDRRHAFGMNYWITRWSAEATKRGASAYVVPDIRYGNEAAWVRERGGRLWRVTRPGADPVNTHASETALADWPQWDVEIVNDGTVAELAAKVEAAL